MRLWSDLAVVAIYAYLLLSIDKFSKIPSQSIFQHLIGYPLVFGTYLVSGVTRRLAYGRYASNVRAIAAFGALFFLLATAYEWIRQIRAIQVVWLNASALLLALLLMILYRLVRRNASDLRKRRKEQGLVIGVDVDGVLANQIQGIIPRVEAKTGITLTYEEITEWNLPVGRTDIKTEIEAAMVDSAYVLGMPPHKGARRVMEILFESNRVFVVTSRPEEATANTKQWLVNQKIPFDMLFNVKGEKKSLYRTDLLIDDYLGNISEFLRNTNGTAILVDQPWNRNRETVSQFSSEGRLHIVSDLEQVLRAIREHK